MTLNVESGVIEALAEIEVADHDEPETILSISAKRTV
jgi:hypothetical protein